MPRAARCGPFGCTIKEEAFARHYFATGNGEEAYLRAYNPSENRKEDWVRHEASQLLKKEPVRKMLDSLRAEANKRSQYTLDKAMERIAVAYNKANEAGQPAAMIAAVRLEAQLQGILIERSERTNKTVKELSDEQLDDALQQAAKDAGYVIQKAQKEAQ